MINSKINIALVSLILGGAIGFWLHSPNRNENGNTVNERRYAMEVAYSVAPAWATSKQTVATMSKQIPGFSASFGGPNNGDATKQIEDIEALISQGVKGIVLFGADEHSLTPVINKAAADGIPVVTFLSDALQSKRLTLIAAGERAGAREIAEMIQTSKRPADPKKKLKVLAMYLKPGMTQMEERLSGIKDALASAPWMDLKEVLSSDSDEAKAAAQITAAWQRYKGVDVIFTLDDRAPIGAIAALKELGVERGKVTVTGWDSTEDVLQGIKNGWIEATVTPNFAIMTQISFNILEANYLNYLHPDARRLNEMNVPLLPSRIEIPTTRIDRSNVDAFLQKK